MQQYFSFIVICIIVCFSSVYCANDTACNTASNTDCQTCLNIKNCAFCKNTKVCFLYDGSGILNPSCGISDMQWQTCTGRLKMSFFFTLNCPIFG